MLKIIMDSGKEYYTEASRKEFIGDITSITGEVVNKQLYLGPYDGVDVYINPSHISSIHEFSGADLELEENNKLNNRN